jgi:hypothetical protein
MTESASRRMRLRVLGSLQLGDWARETSDRGGQDKANWRSRIRRRWTIENPLSAHWFLEALRLALNDIQSETGWLPSGFFEGFQRLKRWRSRTST